MWRLDGDDAVADDAAARVRPGPAGLGEALAARVAEITRRAVVRAVVTLLAALDGPVAAPRRRERLVDRLRDSLRRRHRRVGHAGGQRIAAPDVRPRQAAAGLRNLESRLGDRLRSGIDARGIQRPERGRGLVDVRLTLGGVLHDLLRRSPSATCRSSRRTWSSPCRHSDWRCRRRSRSCHPPRRR